MTGHAQGQIYQATQGGTNSPGRCAAGVAFPRSRSVAPDSLLDPRALKARGLRRAVSEDRALRSTSMPGLKSRASMDVYAGEEQTPGFGRRCASHGV